MDNTCFFIWTAHILFLFLMNKKNYIQIIVAIASSARRKGMINPVLEKGCTLMHRTLLEGSNGLLLLVRPKLALHFLLLETDGRFL